MASTFEFVDRISTSAAVRLDLNGTELRVGTDGIDLSPPPLRRAVASTMLTHGEFIAATAYGNRTIKLPIQVVADSDDQVAAVVQRLVRELARPRNFLRVRLGDTSQPVYFRTYAAPDFNWSMVRLLLETGSAMLELPAEPFALGEQISLGSFTIWEDPAHVGALNTNPYFETNVAGWAGTGTTPTQSGAQFHQGANSMRCTPDGVANTVFASTTLTGLAAGQEWQASAWMRCDTTRVVSLRLLFKDSGGATLATVTNGPTLTLLTWTKVTVGGIAPELTTQVEYQVAYMTGTPVPAADRVYVDEAMIGQVGGLDAAGAQQGGMFFDVSNIIGDVETPLQLEWVRSPSTAASTYITINRRDTPSRKPFTVQVEHINVGTDTTKQTFDASFSGGGPQNWARTTFATDATLINRVNFNPAQWPLHTHHEIIGQYRVFVCVRRNDATATAMQMRWVYTPESSAAIVNGPTVTSWVATATQFALVDLGLIMIPSVELPADGSYGPSGTPLQAVMFDSFAIQAARVSGAANLDWDYILFAPADDRTLVVEAETGLPSFEQVADGHNEMIYTRYFGDPTFADGIVAPGPSVEFAGSFPLLTPGAQVNRVIVIPTAFAGGVDVTDSRAFRASYWPRYLFVRPATT